METGRTQREAPEHGLEDGMARREVTGALLLSAALAGCANYSQLDDFTPPDDEPVEQVWDHQPPPEPEVRPELGAWSCEYAPTMDDDWHNDVLCSNGRDGHRPYLREWDSFVTYDEIMQSALEYDAALNTDAPVAVHTDPTSPDGVWTPDDTTPSETPRPNWSMRVGPAD